jgi:putative GTP pyrophosphokinase
MVEEHVLDLAGVRVVCRYIDDIYHIAKLIENSDMDILRTRDYIQEPKPNGYRSYHVVLRVPVQLSSTCPYMPVEVQIRTIAMDTWASLEHEILYKVNDEEREAKAAYLKECAEELANIDAKMQALFQNGKAIQN